MKYEALKIYETFAGDERLTDTRLGKTLKIEREENLLSQEFENLYQTFNADMIQERFSNKTQKQREYILKSLCLPYTLTEIWGRYMQVYLFDTELEQTFKEMELQPIPSVFANIPYPSLYIEFQSKKDFNEHGVFVSIKYNRKENAVLIFTMGTEGLKSPYTGFISVDKNNIKTDNRDALFVKFALNALYYLCSKNKDIVTEKMDVNSDCIHITKNICGTEYGKIVREKKKEGGKIRKTHYRSAHYHTFRCGKGKKETVIHFLAPILVGNGEKQIQKHYIKKEKNKT